MRYRKLAGRYIPIFGVIVVAGVFLTAHAAFADDGDEKCSKSGQIWVSDEVAKSWINAGGHCAPRGANGPANGNEKCGISELTVKYVTKIDTWRNTGVKCTGGRSMPDLHLQDVHPGTDSNFFSSFRAF